MRAKSLTAALLLAVAPTFGAFAQSQTPPTSPQSAPMTAPMTSPSFPTQVVPDTTSSPAAGKVVTQGADAVQALGAKDFVTQAASSGMFEVETGRLAADKAANDQVRAFGRQMVTDHTQANQQLTTLARQAGIAVPSAPLPMHQQQIQALSQQSGAAFDRQFLGAQVTAHQQAVALFDNASRSTAQDMAPFRSFAAQTLPILQQHLAHAQSLAGTGVPTAKQ